MGAGRIIAIIGGIIGILSIALFFVLPEIFCFYRMEVTSIFGDVSTYLGGPGFASGTLMGVPYPPRLVANNDIFLILTGVLTLAGGIITLIGGAVNKKVVGIIGGLILLGGPLLLIASLFLELGTLGDLTAVFTAFGQSPIFGTYSDPTGTATWGIWIGFFMAIGGGVVGVIGGALSD